MNKVVVKRDPHVDDPPAAAGFRRLCRRRAFRQGARPDVGPHSPLSAFRRAGWGKIRSTMACPARGRQLPHPRHRRDLQGDGLARRQANHRDNPHRRSPSQHRYSRQGEVVSGASYPNFGWALTPMPNEIPKDGSTISVYVDGPSRPSCL
jgi:hypothetical protein